VRRGDPSSVLFLSATSPCKNPVKDFCWWDLGGVKKLFIRVEKMLKSNFNYGLQRLDFGWVHEE
jgi:hypothetical protein